MLTYITYHELIQKSIKLRHFLHIYLFFFNLLSIEDKIETIFPIQYIKIHTKKLINQNKIVSEISDVQKALQTKPIKMGQNLCYVLDGVCEVYINPLSGELIGVLSLMR